MTEPGMTKVNFGEMESGATQIKTIAQDIKTDLDDLKSFLRPLVASWTGDAATAYQTKQTQWDQAANDLFAILHQVGGAVGVANENYQATERANRSTWT